MGESDRVSLCSSSPPTPKATSVLRQAAFSFQINKICSFNEHRGKSRAHFRGCTFSSREARYCIDTVLFSATKTACIISGSQKRSTAIPRDHSNTHHSPHTGARSRLAKSLRVATTDHNTKLSVESSPWANKNRTKQSKNGAETKQKRCVAVVVVSLFKIPPRSPIFKFWRHVASGVCRRDAEPSRLIRPMRRGIVHRRPPVWRGIPLTSSAHKNIISFPPRCRVVIISILFSREWGAPVNVGRHTLPHTKLKGPSVQRRKPVRHAPMGDISAY